MQRSVDCCTWRCVFSTCTATLAKRGKQRCFMTTCHGHEEVVPKSSLFCFPAQNLCSWQQHMMFGGGGGVHTCSMGDTRHQGCMTPCLIYVVCSRHTSRPTCCQDDKTSTAALMQLVPHPKAAWETLAVDTVGLYHSAPTLLWWLICEWQEVFTSKVETAAASFLTDVFSCQSYPVELVTEDVWFDFLVARDINHYCCFNYHPQSGEIEMNWVLNSPFHPSR